MKQQQPNPPEYCERCRRLAPPWEASEYTYWEAIELDDDHDFGVICPGCVTGEEQKEMDEDMDMIDIGEVVDP